MCIVLASSRVAGCRFLPIADGPACLLRLRGYGEVPPSSGDMTQNSVLRIAAPTSSEILIGAARVWNSFLLSSLFSFFMSPFPSEQELFDAACHIGHPREKWNPKIAPYLYGTRKGIHIFDLTKTSDKLKQMIEHLKKLQAEGKSILFVSTKQHSIPLVERLGHELQQPVVTNKWIPGLLTNWDTVKERIQYYLDLRQQFQSGEIEKYTKKEQTQLRKKLAKLDTALSGVAHMKGRPHAMFVIDAMRDEVAVLEARKLKIPVFGICDSNANPDYFESFVPANDDALKSIDLLLQTVLSALQESKKKAPASEATKS